MQGTVVGTIGPGLCIFLGVAETDGAAEVTWMADKIVNLRIFEDGQQKMNNALLDIKGEALIVSQFTLYGDCRKGRRPSFCAAAGPEHAEAIYEQFKRAMAERGIPVASGTFQAHMVVQIANDGPVTIFIEKEAKHDEQEAPS